MPTDSMMSLVQAPKRRHVDMSNHALDDLMEKYTKIKTVFQKVGMDLKADLNIGSLFGIMQKVDHSLSEDNAQAMLQEMDRGRKGSVSWNEFLRWLFQMDEYYSKVMTQEVDVRPSVSAQIFNDHTNESCLDAWTDSTLTLKGGGQNAVYTFCGGVLPPTISQEEAFAALTRGLVISWHQKITNCMFLVHGDPTSKSQMLLGSQEASRCFSSETQPGWGLLPRTVHHHLEISKKAIMAKADSGALKVILAISILEFCDGQCFDLLHDHAPVTIDDRGMPTGATYGRLHKTEDLVEYLDKLDANLERRRGEGSCCHYAVHLTNLLAHIDEFGDVLQAGDVSFCHTSFSFVDMASAEQTMLPDQSKSIKQEFDVLRKETQKAAASTNKKPYKPLKKKDGATDFVRFVSASLTGHAKLGMAVCLRPSSDERAMADSCSLGSDLSQLRLSVHLSKPQLYEKALDKACADRQKAKETFANTPKVGAKAPFWPLRKCQYESAAAFANFVEQLDPRQT